MRSTNTCDSLKSELKAWKQSVSNIANKFESKSGHAKADVLENIEDINILAHDLQNRIDQLEETCSLNGFDNIKRQQQIDVTYQLNVRDSDVAVETIGGGNFGG